MLAKAPARYVPAPAKTRALARRAVVAGTVVGTTGATVVGAYHAVAWAWAWAAASLAVLPVPLLFLAAAVALAVVGLPLSTWRASRQVATRSMGYRHCGGSAVDVDVAVRVRVR